MIKCDGFIRAMNSSCKMMDAKVVIDGTVYFSDNLISVNPYYEGTLLCSVMKCCDMEIQFDEEIDSAAATALKGKTVSSVKIGAKQESDTDFSYIEYGEYRVYSAEYREESNSVYLTCYDSMLDAMVAYNMELTDSLTVKAYLSQICSYLGWELADASFANENLMLDADAVNSYLPQTDDDSDEDTQTSDSAYTYRDALDDIAEIIGGNLIFKNDNLLYPVYPAAAVTEDDELAQLSVDNQQSLSFEEQFGPVNSVSVVNSDSADAVVLSDAESVEANGECQITIKDNPLMKANRTTFINGIFNKLNGLYYIPFAFTAFGYGYMEFGDIFNLEDKKGNLKKTIMLSDNFLLSLTVQETASAKAYSADSETEYSVSTPLDKVIVEVKQLKNSSTNLNERIESALKSISKATDGHAVMVDLEYDAETQRYYVGDGEADTVIVSENPAIATDSEPKDWNSGRIVRINYNGIAVSTEGIGGPYSDFAVYYDETLNKYLINADDIAVGTLQGIKAILEEGIIGGYEIGENQLKTSWTESSGTYEFKIKQAVDDEDEQTYDDDFVQILRASDESSYRYLLHKDGTVEGSTLVSDGDVEVNGKVIALAGNLNLIGAYGNYGITVGKEISRFTDGGNRSSIESVCGALCIGTNYTLYSFGSGFRWTINNDTSKAIAFTTDTNTLFRPYETEQIYLGAASYRWKTVYCTGTNTSSDRKLKEDISPILSSKKLKEFFMRLTPVFYRMKDGDSGRKHMGFVAQDVACVSNETLGDLSVFQAAVIDEEGKEKYFDKDVSEKLLSWGLCYDELIAPMWAMCQMQQTQIDSLEKRVKLLEGKLNDKN